MYQVFTILFDKQELRQHPACRIAFWAYKMHIDCMYTTGWRHVHDIKLTSLIADILTCMAFCI